jgi:hypothetical protein
MSTNSNQPPYATRQDRRDDDTPSPPGPAYPLPRLSPLDSAQARRAVQQQNRRP